MRKSRISVFASVATGATLALAGAGGGTPWSPASRNSASSYEPFQVPRAVPAYHTVESIPSNMRVVEVLTSFGTCMKHAERTPADINTARSTSAGARTKQSANRAVPNLVHGWGTPVDWVQLPSNPTTVDVSFAYFFEGSTASSWAPPLTMPPVPLQATAGHDTCFHHNSEGKDHHGSKSRQKPPLPPNRFLARFYIALHYLADVIKADNVCAILFGRWAQRYYQRIRKNRADRRRRRSLRRWSRFASRMCLVLRDALPLNRAASSTVQKDQGKTERPSAAEVDMMPPAGDSDGTSSLARDSAIRLVEGASLLIDEEPAATTACRENPLISTAASAPTSPLTEQGLSTTHAAHIEPTTDDIPHRHSPDASPPLEAVASTIETSPSVGQPTTEVALASKPSPTETRREEENVVGLTSAGASSGVTGETKGPSAYMLPVAGRWQYRNDNIPRSHAHWDRDVNTVEETADKGGDVNTQQATRQFIGWEDIGREAYYDHALEASMANIYDVQSFHTFERKGRIFMAGFSSGLGIEQPSRSFTCGLMASK